jgi:hypothetical protein
MSHLIRFLGVTAAVLVLLTLLTWRRVYVVSPSGRQTITFFQPCTLPFSGNYYYLLPYRYNGLTAPDAGYVLVEPHGECTFHVNWDSEEGHRLKLHLTGRVLANTLDPARAVYAATPNGYLDRDETYFYPKYGSYMFEHILDKKYEQPKPASGD